jgi:hypothetical protein
VPANHPWGHPQQLSGTSGGGSRDSTHFGHRRESRDCPVSALLKFNRYESTVGEALAERELGMLSLPRLMTTLILAGGMSLLNGAAAPADTRVDLALVLAVDVSFSMEPDEQDLQRHGFIEAFQSPEVHQAVRQGMLGRIAVTYVEWAGAFDQEIIVPWTVIEQPGDGLALAERLSRSPLHRMGYTSVSGVIDFGVRQLRQSGLRADRRVIDVSGDGANNSGRTVTLARDEALARGITINGLPIMLKRPEGIWDIEDLDLYFRDCVIGGPGAFLVPVREKTQFIEAIKAKIIREITDQWQPRSLVQPAQADLATDCLAGELRRHQPTAR